MNWKNRKKNPQALSELVPFWLNWQNQLAGYSERAHGIFFSFIYFLEYDTIVSINGLSLGYSEQDTSSVKEVVLYVWVGPN